MKATGTIIWVVGAVAVLAASIVAGLGVREIRTRKAVEIAEEKQAQEAPSPPAPGGAMAQRLADRLAPEQQRQIERDNREQMRQRVENMSDQERDEFFRQRGERFRADGPDDGRQRRMPMMSEEDRARTQEMRARWETMSDEERQEYREQMRQRFGGGRRGAGRMRPGEGGPGPALDGSRPQEQTGEEPQNTESSEQAEQ